MHVGICSIPLPRQYAHTSPLTVGMPKTVIHALKKDSESSVIKTLGEIQVCSLIAANASVNAVESCRLLKMNAARNPSLLSSKTNSVAK
ncbi:hypothetical protein TNIN_456681 [Trichonephila inaurata madagascariensis]|uniref:Uncharacterized protein n=1 Tax=Trichonephila inaurata madagascariensis TaxID=2747483 RepID=A0A8X6MAQ2_9ARAC|nr:hypothetical protein TNIN_456681 [Trichonephila inaurata madagascariensis]